MSRVALTPIAMEPTVSNREADYILPSRQILSIYDLLGDEIHHQKLNCNNIFSQQLLSQTQNIKISGASPENVELICVQSTKRYNIVIESSHKLLKRTLYPVSINNTFYQLDNAILPSNFMPINPYQQTLISIAQEVMTQNIKYSMEPQQKYKLDQICGIKLV